MPRFAWPYAALTAIYCAGIFVLSAQSILPDRAPTWLDWPGADKVAHVVVFGGLALVVYAGLVNSNAHVDRLVRIVIPIGFVAVYGITDEVHQRFVPNRSFSALDLLADTAGATILVLALEGWRRKMGKTAGTPAR